MSQSTHEVPIKPYGQQNIGGSISVPEVKTTIEVKPPAGQSSFYGAGRGDVEVKPYGTSEQQLPRETLLKPRTSRPFEQLKNPLVATVLGITLALLLWSLSHVPRMVTGWWHGPTLQQKTYDAYDSVTRQYPRDVKHQASARAGEVYQAGKDTVESAKDKASEKLQNAKDYVESTGESIYNKVTGGSGGSYYPSDSLTDEARRAACRTAERARDIACQTGDYAPGVRDSLNAASRSAEDAASNVQSKASEIYEAAKLKASEILEAAKNTVTYPVHAATDSVVHTGEAVVDRASATYEAAKDTVLGAAGSVKDSVVGTKDAVKDSVLGAKDSVVGTGEMLKNAASLGSTVQSAKDTVVGAGEAVKNAASNTIQGVKDTVTGAAQAVRDATTSSSHSETHEVVRERGPTKVKVEVTEL